MPPVKRSNRKKEAAERKLKTQAMHRDYWSVSDYQDNSEELQEILDVLFNSVEGNNYVVDYMENQNGTRLIIKCKVCCKDLSSYDPFITHENGKNHKKVRQKMICVADPNLENDMKLQPLNKYRGTFAEGSLEDQVDSTRSNVLGMQFVYKEIIDGEDAYTCQLCQRSSDAYMLSASRMFTHLTSLGHNQNYLEVKFGYIKKSSRDFEEECCHIEELEGKVHVNVADLTMQYDKGHNNWQQRRPRSPSTCERKPKVPKIEPPEVIVVDDTKECCVQKSQTCDVGITADISSEARFILHEINALQEADCQMILQDDTDMQDLLMETLWVLANKMEKYFNQTGATYSEGKTKTPLSVCAEKVKQYIAKFAELKITQ
ncbi:uncharacterized protein LOC123517268 [Portunus trituberculatus]|uniref:uncharacterized protein LOC123517268 n=1 Tax=Portunus trituberculatus TaxID=210409 RepID=UPI001E1D022D|nr:uncharacterized protein LOC123517268 [Portunus trituberculatus]